MKSLGYETTVTSLVNQDVHHTCGDCPGAGLKAITAIKKGTTRPDEWIMMMGHYDTLPSTIDGAYDNGAGTNFIRWMAHELKDVPTNRSVVFTFYNGEEEGLLASARHAAMLQAQKQKIHMVFGFDMVGIAYPVAPSKLNSTYCLCAWYGQPNAYSLPMMRYVNYEYLKFPAAQNLVSVGGPSQRNSDERSFATRGVPTIRWAGMRTASNYPAYHLPDDTLEKIAEVAGGVEYYQQGVHNTLKSVYYTLGTVDNHPPAPALAVSTDGLSVSVDGTESSDEDGALSSFSWDFGDGTTATGETASHTYSAPGTYTITLTVADNLWSEVTETVQATVTVG